MGVKSSSSNRKQNSLKTKKLIKQTEQIQNLSTSISLNKSKIIKNEQIQRPVGLINLKNNCYINSILQCLNNIPKFKDGLYQIESNNQFLKEIIKLFKEIDDKENMKNNKNIFLDISSFLEKVKNENEIFNNDDHHDATEFLFWLLNHIHDLIIKDSPNVKRSFVMNLFEGEQFSITKCLCCENEFRRNEKFLNLTLDIKNNVSLTSCMKNYIRKEIMKYKDKFYCGICNSLQEAEKK